MYILHLYICILLIWCSYFVAFSSNSINSVINLIFSFCNAAILLFFFNIEFLGITFIIIYVGAIAVLFLFVIMMLNIKSKESLFFSHNSIVKSVFYFIIYYIGILFFIKFYGNIFSLENYFIINNNLNLSSFLDNLSNVEILGQILFNYADTCLLLAGLILLISLVGAIVLTLNFKSLQKGQLISKQLAKSANILIFYNK